MSERKEKLYSQEHVEAAIDLVQSGDVGLREASRAFNIPPSTLREKISGRRPVKARNKFLLHPEEEKQIVEWLKVHAEGATPRSVKDLRMKVKEVLDLRGGTTKTKDGLPGRDWVLSFRKRFPDLSMRGPKALGKERALTLLPDKALQIWFAQLRQFLDAQDPSLLLSADRIFQADETGFPLLPGTGKVLAPSGAKQANSLSYSKRQQLTVLGCSSAAGEYVGPLIVFPLKRMPTSNLLEGFDEAFIQMSPNGWVNTMIFKTWMSNVFIPFVENKKKPVVLFVDGHTGHNSDLSVLDMCSDYGIILYEFLPHVSHISQPLEMFVYGSMRAEWLATVKAHIDNTGETASMANFAKLLKRVWVKCATPEASRQGFMRSGIFPFDPDRPMSSGKMGSSKAFMSRLAAGGEAPVEDDARSAPPPRTPSVSTSEKWDTMSALLHLADRMGLDKSISFLLAAKQNSPPEEDQEFENFRKLLLDLGLSPPRVNPAATTSSGPSAPTNSRSLVASESGSVSLAFSSPVFKQECKEELVKVESEAKKAKKSDLKKSKQSKAKEIRQREKEKMKERNRIEHERKKKERDMKKREKLFKGLKKKKNVAQESSEEDDSCEMVSDSDTEWDVHTGE